MLRPCRGQASDSLSAVRNSLVLFNTSLQYGTPLRLGVSARGSFFREVYHSSKIKIRDQPYGAGDGLTLLVAAFFFSSIFPW